jgi:murein L,D-transpeptidase YafK
MVHQSGSIALIRASPIRARLCRALLTSALLAGSLALAGCNTDVYQLPTRAMKELSPEMLALLGQKGMPKESPILVRIFKEESELEVWKQDTTGRFELLKVYPICRWSGELGPKVREGDRQAPEGFYTITPSLMNPNSSYYLAINTGFPNAYDRANGRSGAFLMIHGDCSSRGCYAMTDEQIGEIYSLGREAFLGGQQSFQIQAYPFRMTGANLARHRTNPNMPFWRMIKEGNDHFEVTHMEPKVDVCDRRYVFDAQSPGNSGKALAFSPAGHCPAYEVAPQVAAAAREKDQRDEAQFAQLARFNVPVAPVKTGTDGGSNRVFIAQIENSTRSVDSEGHVHVVLPPAGSVPETTGAVADNSSARPSLASRLFGGIFGGSKNSGESTKVATADASASTGAQEQRSGGFLSNLFSSRSGSSSSQQASPAGAARGPEAPAGAAATQQKPKPPAHSDTHTEVAAAAPSGARAKSRIEAETAAQAQQKAEPQPQKMEPQETAAVKPKPAVQQEANAAGPGSSAVLSGAQRTVPVGNFESRWTGMQ